MQKNIINSLPNLMISKNDHKPIQINSIFCKPKFNSPLMIMKTLKSSLINSWKKENFKKKKKTHWKETIKALSWLNYKVFNILKIWRRPLFTKVNKIFNKIKLMKSNYLKK